MTDVGERVKRIELDFFGRPLIFEAGKLARQSDSSVTVQFADTMVLVTVVGEKKKPREGADFIPLVVDYLERSYAAGKIPGGFFKREGRPSEKEIITSRLIDRPVRPLLPKGYPYDVQIIAQVLSSDQENEADVLALTGASAALLLSDIPFDGPIAAVRVGRIDGKLVVNPTQAEMAKSDMDIVVACKDDYMVMVEGATDGVAEDALLEALEFAQDAVKPLLEAQRELQESLGKAKREFEPTKMPEDLANKIADYAEPFIREAMDVSVKLDRYAKLDEILNEVSEKFRSEIVEWKIAEAKERGRVVTEADVDPAKVINAQLEELYYGLLRRRIVDEGWRIGGRKSDEVRPIHCEVGLLPRTHGSALFTRGETQALVLTTLGTSEDEQRLDNLVGEPVKPFMVHYNFHPFCTGEVKMLRSPGRREIGHGVLAERALKSVLPPDDLFPYTIRIVSEILESNGSSSMATVCGGTLSLMDAGVPIKAPVAGIAMGLIKEGEKYVVITDLLGDEDHAGDMDFKVAGTRTGITAVQMDIKIAGITREIMAEALEQARRARAHVLNKMTEVLDKPRPELSEYAPRIYLLHIPQERVRNLIGPGGKNIQKIIAETGVKIDIEEPGRVHVISNDGPSAKKAIKLIRAYTHQVRQGEFYVAKVLWIEDDFGATVELFPGTTGLVHISQIDNRRVNKVSDVLKEGDEILVKVVSVDPQGKMKLSRKAALGVPLEKAVKLDVD